MSGSGPEAAVKRKVVAHLKKLDAYYFFPIAGPYARGGVPDIVACIRGKFVGIECKSARGKPTTLQRLELDSILQAGGVALVINPQSMELGLGILTELAKRERDQ